MGNVYETLLGIPKPACCSHGDCCKGASPSKPFYQLLRRAAEGDDFARSFFTIMAPYPSHEAAEAVVPGVVAKTLAVAEKNQHFPNGKDDVVFYHCRFLQDDNRCGIYEDRPQFCRDYPDTPFIVMSEGCAYQPWAKACKAKYAEIKQEAATLETLKTRLQQDVPLSDQDIAEVLGLVDDTNLSAHNTQQLSLVLSLTGLYLTSPVFSYFQLFSLQKRV